MEFQEKSSPRQKSAVGIVWTAHWSKIFLVVVLLFPRLLSLRTIDVTSEKEQYYQKENSSTCAPNFIYINFS